MKRKVLWAALVLTVIATFVWPMIPVASAEKRLAAIPKSGPDFLARPLPLTKEDRAFLDKAKANQYLIAVRGGGQLIMTVIDGTENRHAVHDPSYCFSGAGWKVESKHEVKLSSGDATLVALGKGHEKANALWFFDDGKSQFTSPVQYWLETSGRRITLGASGDEPILVTLRSLPGEPVDWDRVRQILLPALGFD